jgi:hypothetical protein
MASTLPPPRAPVADAVAPMPPLASRITVALSALGERGGGKKDDLLRRRHEDVQLLPPPAPCTAPAIRALVWRQIIISTGRFDERGDGAAAGGGAAR